MSNPRLPSPSPLLPSQLLPLVLSLALPRAVNVTPPITVTLLSFTYGIASHFSFSCIGGQDVALIDPVNHEQMTKPPRWLCFTLSINDTAIFLRCHADVTATIPKSTLFHANWQRTVRFWLDPRTWPNITLSALRRAIRILPLPLNAYKRNI